jgi:hypothetical protein
LETIAKALPDMRRGAASRAQIKRHVITPAKPHAREAGTALVALPDGFTVNNRAPLLALATRHLLPAINSFRIHTISVDL